MYNDSLHPILTFINLFQFVLQHVQQHDHYFKLPFSQSGKIIEYIILTSGICVLQHILRYSMKGKFHNS